MLHGAHRVAVFGTGDDCDLEAISRERVGDASEALRRPAPRDAKAPGARVDCRHPSAQAMESPLIGRLRALRLGEVELQWLVMGICPHAPRDLEPVLDLVTPPEAKVGHPLGKEAPAPIV